MSDSARGEPESENGRGPMGTRDLSGGAVHQLAPPSRIVELRVRGTGATVQVPAVVSFTVGRVPLASDAATPGTRPRSDVRIASPRRAMSLVHAAFEWRSDQLWCRDLGSTNGTRADGVMTHDWFPISNGLLLDLGDVGLTALDWHHARLCHALAWCLGLSATVAVDRAIDVLRRDGPLLLLGDRGCDQEWLARQIHDASARRDHPFVSFEGPLLRADDERLTSARVGSAFVDLSRVSRVTNPFARALFAGETRLGCVRPIVAAVDAEQVRKALGDVPQFSVLRMAPLADRKDDVVPLMNRLLAEHESAHRIEELGERWSDRLREHPWPRNLSELRETERRLRVLLESANRTEAARRLGTSRQALDKFLRRILDED